MPQRVSVLTGIPHGIPTANSADSTTHHRRAADEMNVSNREQWTTRPETRSSGRPGQRPGAADDRTDSRAEEGARKAGEQGERQIAGSNRQPEAANIQVQRRTAEATTAPPRPRQASLSPTTTPSTVMNKERSRKTQRTYTCSCYFKDIRINQHHLYLVWIHLQLPGPWLSDASLELIQMLK
uniref:Uncharacterized protein n=1 Tax=Sphaerodactylus townsendi TaxID=933632 RepID=A0ACB8FAS0_9SAUR